MAKQQAKSGGWPKVGSLRKSKEGKLYLKFDAGVSVAEGGVLSLQDPRKRLDSLVESGKMSEEKAEELKAKIPEYIRYEVFQPPSDPS
jgi:hypothetical protein